MKKSINADSNITAGLSSEADYYSYLDLGLTCSLPVPVADLKVYGGYAVGKIMDEDAGAEFGLQYKGPVAGVIGKMPIGDKLTITGTYGLGIGTEVGLIEDDVYVPTPDFITASMMTYRLGIAYKVMPLVSVELGYAGFDYGWEDEESDDSESMKLTGIYLGARASF